LKVPNIIVPLPSGQPNSYNILSKSSICPSNEKLNNYSNACISSNLQPSTKATHQTNSSLASKCSSDILLPFSYQSVSATKKNSFPLSNIPIDATSSTDIRKGYSTAGIQHQNLKFESTPSSTYTKDSWTQRKDWKIVANGNCFLNIPSYKSLGRKSIMIIKEQESRYIVHVDNYQLPERSKSEDAAKVAARDYLDTLNESIKLKTMAEKN
jgi:hypothetical protein